MANNTNVMGAILLLSSPWRKLCARGERFLFMWIDGQRLFVLRCLLLPEVSVLLIALLIGCVRCAGWLWRLIPLIVGLIHRRVLLRLLLLVWLVWLLLLILLVLLIA